MRESASSRLERASDRLGATEAVVHAYVHVDIDEARKDAEAADATEPVGSLHGLPFAVKEVIDVSGVVTAAGSRVFADRVPGVDATVVQRLRAAGAVLVGTHVSHELTCGLDQPATRNPWAPDRYPGGSSAGGGVSVAVGSSDFALGTDAAGSVRIPGAMTGVVGLKPTAGLVSSSGVVREATAPSIDHVGVLARRVSNVAEVLAAIAGPDPADAATLRVSASPSTCELLGSEGASIEGLSLGVFGEATQDALNELVAPESEVVEVVDAAYQQLKELGATLVPVELPTLVRSSEAIFTFFSTELAAAHRRLLEPRRAAYHPAVAEMLAQALKTPSEQVVEAVEIRTTLRREVEKAFSTSGVRLLVSPTTPRVAMPLDSFDPTEELGTLIPYTCPFNLTGQPAVSVPCGFTGDALPVGLQIVGTAYGEAEVLRVASAYEQATGWHDRRPRIVAESGVNSDLG